ncbi:MAG: serine/threonine-protein kinase [Candidatus Obscuribacterales bacterium]|nr:serine/threonine-protein kinase [Candidatus Obscuribacterales bacterium]
MSKDSWPTPQDYNEAIQSPRACFSDPDLMNGEVTTNAIGLPRSMTGAFASVYKIVTGDKAWAVRCFLTNRLDQRERYKHISDFVLFDDLACTIDFYYLDEGIKIKGNWYPCLKMPWVEGETLDQYITKRYQTPGALKQLLADFHDMIDQLERANIGHGDLQHGNIIVTSDGLRLVDYDALFVPALAGRKSLELGHPNYQHPDRNEHHYDQDVDNFSCWLIHASMLAIAIDPLLYERHGGGDECLLFRQHDLASPEQSKLFDELKHHSSEHLREAVVLLERMLWAQPLSVPILDCPEEKLELLPKVRGQNPKVEQTEPTRDNEVSQTDSTPSPSRNRFDFIDDDALFVQTQAKKKQASATQRLQKLRTSNKKVFNDFYLWLSPQIWTKKQMQQALSQFDNGNYDDALNIYLNIYRTINQKYKLPEELFWCLMGMGYCSGLSDKTSMAGNYFLLATKNAESDIERLRASLCLAVNRYDVREFDGAFKALSDLKGDDFVEAVKLEMQNVYVLRSSTYHLLRELIERLINIGDRPQATSIAVATSMILEELVKTRSIKVSDESFQSIISQALRLWQEGFHLFALTTFSSTGEVCLDSQQVDKAWESLLLSFVKCNCCANAVDAGLTRRGRVRALKSTMKNATLEDLASFSKLVESTGKFVGADNLEEALLELIDECLADGLVDQAAELLIITRKFSSRQRVLLSSSSVELLKRFPERSIWRILTEGFFEEDDDIGQLVCLLGTMSDVRLLANIALGLAREKKSVTLAAFYLHLVFSCTSEIVDAVFSILLKESSDKGVSATMTLSLTESCRFFMSEIDTHSPFHTQSKKDVVEVQRLLNAVLTLHSLLERINPDSDASWIIDKLVQPRYSIIISQWMLSLTNDHGRKRLTDFLQMLLNRCAVSTIGEFIVGLTTCNPNNDLEIIIAGIRAWGVSKDDLSSILGPSIDHCISKLEQRLSHLAKQDGAIKQGDPTSELRLFQSLYELISISQDSQLEVDYNLKLARIYCQDNMPYLSLLAKHKDIGKEIYCGIALGLALQRPDQLEIIAIDMVNQKQKQRLYDICKTLLLAGQVSQVVSLCEALQKREETFFASMCRVALKTIPDKNVYDLSVELTSRSQHDLNAILIRELRATERPALFISVICKSPVISLKAETKFEFSPDFTDIGYLSGAAHLAALSGDDSLAKFLSELDEHDVHRDDRIVICTLAAAVCGETLQVLKARIIAKGESNEIEEIGILNMSALERLFLHCETSDGQNVAFNIMHNPDYRIFLSAWVREQGKNNDIDKLSFLYMRAAQLNEVTAVAVVVLELARLNKLRLLISLSRQICAGGYTICMGQVLKLVADADLTEAFGTISLELVTSTCDREVLKQLLNDISNADPALIRILLRQIAFYRGPETLIWLSRPSMTNPIKPEKLLRS